MFGICFNPRLREGGDADENETIITNAGFNPRLREGGDAVKLGYLWYDGVSIHASAREATRFPRLALW